MPLTQKKARKGYLKIRNQCGILGVLLPWLALFSAGIAQHPSPEWWYSISSTYYQSPALVAVMVPTCLVLFNYEGYDRWDNLVTNLCALFGMMIVLFPNKVSWIAPGSRVGFFQVPIEASGLLHGISSALFFICVAINFIFLFTKSRPGHVPSKWKRRRNRIYRICGWVTLVLLFFCLLVKLGVIPRYSMMIIEILLMTVFGFGWLVKGEFFSFLNTPPEEKDYS